MSRGECWSGRVVWRPLLEDGEVAFGVEAVQPFLVDDRAQAAPYRVAARRRVARGRHRMVSPPTTSSVSVAMTS